MVVVLDATVLVHALGADHPLREPARGVLRALADGHITATTTAEVLEEFLHVRAHRHGRGDAIVNCGRYLAALTPLLEVGEPELHLAVRLFGRHEGLGSAGALLAAAAIQSGHTLVSADGAFKAVTELRWLDPTSLLAQLSPDPPR